MTAAELNHLRNWDYNVSYAIFGGTAPFVATYLIAVTDNRLAPAIYITVVAVIAFVVSLLTPETAGRVFRAGAAPATDLGNATAAPV